jgi:5-methyltetrahydrofolate--homocysteine methyltransferase
MLPTASVSGWYFANPDAKYFGVAKINVMWLREPLDYSNFITA